MATIKILKNYNNYFNRTLVTAEPTGEQLVYEDNVNFNPNDNVNTNMIIGKIGKPYHGTGDYAIVIDGNEVTHWFIMENVRTRGNQFRVTFRRDLLRDFYSQWTGATCRINKATVENNSPYIFNSENISLNQIKKAEEQLKDESKVAWICGFIARDNEAQNLTLKTDIIPDIIVDNINDWEFNDYVNDGISYLYETGTIDFVFNERFNEGGYFIYSQLLLKEFSAPAIAPAQLLPISNDTTLSVDYLDVTKFSKFMAEKKSSVSVMWSAAESIYVSEYPTYYTVENTVNNLRKLKGKIIKDSTTNKYYVIRIREEIKSIENKIITQKAQDDSFFYDFVNNYAKSFNGTMGNSVMYATYYVSNTRIELEETAYGEYTVDFPSASDRLLNKNAPFDLFCIPYGDNIIIQGQGARATEQVEFNKQKAMAISSELGRVLDKKCYDIQLLPYCPMTGYISSETVEGKVLFDINATDTKRYTEIKKGDALAGYIYWSTSSSGTFDIIKNITTENLKIENECKFLRLVSPNYNGQFEFNLAKNGGEIQYFNVDYTYLPYSSYIHVNPNFGRLYGADYDDARGLICQGDFSIMYLSDAWVQYQTQNKNYDNIFNRQIQNMDVKRKYQRVEQAVSGVANALGTGAAIGITTMNPVAGIAAATASAAAGGADFAIQEALYREEKAYASDMHEYQLDNIKALPDSIAKTTAYTNNNKIFPTLEYYSCTEKEMETVARIIANTGMTVGIIDLPINYVGNSWSYGEIEDRGFIRADIIKVSGIDDDTHVATELSKELSKGVYLK